MICYKYNEAELPLHCLELILFILLNFAWLTVFLQKGK